MDSNRPPETLLKNHRFAGGQIPPNPRSSGHRRAQSESFFRLPDEFLFDTDYDFNFPDFDLPSVSDDNISGRSYAATVSIPADSGGMSKSLVVHPVARPCGGRAHLRSLSLDTAVFDGLSFEGLGAISGSVTEKNPQHQHSGYTDGATFSFEEESMLPSADYSKEAEKIAELALIDPKRAKRILANRQSAARSKERKIRHTSELERKVQTLQTEAATLLSHLTLLQRDSTGLTSENRELKLRLQSMEQQAHLSDALNEALREEVQRLKIATSHVPDISTNTFSIGFQQSSSSYFSHPQQISNQKTQQIHSGMLISHLNLHLNANGQAFNDLNVHDPMDLMQ